MCFEEYKKIIKGRMSEKRYIHSVNVAKEAVVLAKRFGADEEKAKIAGILHDITKESTHEEQLQIIQENGIILDNIQMATPKLWHSISGAAYIKSKLNIIDEDILNAVRYHTSGRQNMSLLEKVIFIADFTGAERDYDGVDIMRKKAKKSLEEAMQYGIAFTISDLVEANLPIHSDTFNTYNEVVIKNKK